MTTPTFDAIVAAYRKQGYSPSEALSRARLQTGAAAEPTATYASAAVRRLECRVDDFVRALRLLAAAQKRGSGVTVSFTENELTLTRGATTVRAPAQGNWTGTATVSVKLIRELLRLHKALPDPVVISASPSRLSVSHYSTPCW